VKPIAGIAVALGLALAGSARGQRSDLNPGLRHALEIDPFAEAPLRLVLSGGAVDERVRKWVAQFRGRSDFVGCVVAARLELLTGHADRAREDVQRAAAVLPGDVVLLDRFSALASSVAAYVPARLAAERALRAAPSARRAVALAEAELHLGLRREALAHIAEAQRLEPNAEDVLSQAADALAAQRLYAEAAHVLYGLANRPGAPASPLLWRRVADMERNAGNWQAAAKALLAALDHEPSAAGRRGLVQNILSLYRAHHGLRELQGTLAKATTAPRLLLRGDALREQGQLDLAKAAYRAAAQADARDAEPWLRLAAMTGSSKQTAEIYARLGELYPDELSYALECAKALGRGGDAGGARAVLDQAAARFDNSPAAQDRIAKQLADQGALDAALRSRLRAVALDPGNSDYALALAATYRALGKLDQAHTVYRDFLRRSGERAAYDRVLSELEKQGDAAELTRLYRDAVTRWQSDLDLRRSFAQVLERQKDYRAALAQWQEIERQVSKPFEREQARFHRERLEQQLLLLGRP
jgi:tetratricopeptide (TPR) repeat protein